MSSHGSKHIDVVYHPGGESVARREVEFSYISTHVIMADMFTKPVPGNKLQICCEGNGVE